jgi:hypothetical protein
MPPEGAQEARQRAPVLCLALLDLLVGLKCGRPQFLQLLLRGVIGRLHGLSLGGRVPQGGPQV